MASTPTSSATGRKVQVPVMGGLRKVIRVGQQTSNGTTLAGFENQTLTLDQLRAQLGLTSGLALQVQPGGTPSTGGGGGTTDPFQKGATWVSSSGAIVTPANDVVVVLPRACNLQSVTILTQGGPGSCSVDIWQSTLAAFPPVVGGTIVSGGLPTITSGLTYVNTALTGWTKVFPAGTILLIHLASSSTLTEVSVTLQFI